MRGEEDQYKISEVLYIVKTKSFENSKNIYVIKIKMIWIVVENNLFLWVKWVGEVVSQNDVKTFYKRVKTKLIGRF